MNLSYNSDKLIVQSYVDQAKVALPDMIQHAYWFGSRARGMGHPDSDYDLLLETTTELSEMQRDALAIAHDTVCSKHTHLIAFFQKEFAKPEKLDR